MSADWSEQKLGDLISVQNGCAFNSKQFSEQGEMPLIRIRDLKSGVNTATRYNGSYENKYLVHKGDLLIGMDGEFQCHEWNVPDGLLNQRVCRLDKFSESLLPRFLYYGINKYLKDIERDTSFTTVKHLSARQVQSIKFPIPPTAEQKRIVAILDEAFAGIEAAIANTEKNLVNADELFDRYLNSLFDNPNRQWSGKKLGDLGTVQTGSTPKTAEKGNYGNYVPFIKPGDFLRDGSLNYSNQALSHRGAEKARVLPKGAVLMVCIGATIGKAGYTEQEVTTNQQINALSPDEEYSAKFIYYQMLSDRFQRTVMSSAGQTTLPIISKKKWSNLEIQVPPTLSEQCAVVEKLDELDLEIRRLSRNYRLKRANLQELKQSLLQKAFTGELTAEEMETEAREATA